MSTVLSIHAIQLEILWRAPSQYSPVFKSVAWELQDQPLHLFQI